MAEKARKGWLKPVAILGALVSVIVIVRALGLFQYVSVENISKLNDWIEGFGILAPLVYIIFYILGCVFFLPGIPLTLVGAVAFGSIWGTIYVSIGSTLGASVAFLVARYAARSIVEDWMTKNPRLRKIDEGVQNQGWRMLMITRLVPIFPFNIQNYVYGITRIPFPTYVIVSWICMVPGTIAYVFAGGAIVSGEGDPKKTILYLAVAGVFFVLLSFLPGFIKKRYGDELTTDSGFGQGGTTPPVEKTLGASTPYAADILDRCIGEEPTACQAACPLHIDNRRMAELIGEGRFSEALAVVREKLPFPKMLGMVCTHACEDVCKRSEVDQAIAICVLKRFVADRDDAPPPDLTIEPEKDRRVAVVGGGPAGLMAALELRKKGYSVTLFEAEAFLGGAARLYIPPFRLPTEVIEEETGIIPGIGVEMRLNTRMGRDIELEELVHEYDAVFLATGTHESIRLAVPGEHIPGVCNALDFLRKARLCQKVEIGDRVVVIGGGNAAIDAARTARRMGASDVRVLYRRSEIEMPALASEVKEAEGEAVCIEYLAAPTAVTGEERVEFIQCIRMELGPEDKSGRRRPIPIEGSDFSLPVDSVIVAIGQAADAEALEKEPTLALSRKGTIVVDPVTLQTSLPGVFAGGDIVSGPANVVTALAAGRHAAFSIDSTLQNREITELPREFQTWQTRLQVDTTDVPRQARLEMPRLDAADRLRSTDQVELGFSMEMAMEEAGRCLSCECRTCVKNCSYLDEYCHTPKDLAREFEGLDGDGRIVPYSCNLCSLCGEVCPEELDVARLCLETREELVRSGQGPLTQHKPVLSNQKWGTSKTFTLALPDPSTGKCERAFFPGCGLPSYSPQLVIDTYAYLRERLPNTGIVLNCCGAPTRFLGDKEGFKAICSDFVEQVKSLGTDKVIFACPDCYHTLSEHAPDLKGTTLYQAMVEYGPPEPAAGKGTGTFAIHDSCITRHETDLHESVRQLMSSLGHRVEEMEYSRKMTKCCGAGGMAWNANPDFLSQVIGERAEETDHDMISYCAGCRLAFASAKKPSLHILDLFFNPDWSRDKFRAPPHPLVKWRNRWKLKRQLQKSIR
ncbi:FAD-dependent oxidoreductase [Thermodesulfobacteriota bacterium]